MIGELFTLPWQPDDPDPVSHRRLHNEVEGDQSASCLAESITDLDAAVAFYFSVMTNLPVKIGADIRLPVWMDSGGVSSGDAQVLLVERMFLEDGIRYDPDPSHWCPLLEKYPLSYSMLQKVSKVFEADGSHIPKDELRAWVFRELTGEELPDE